MQALKRKAVSKLHLNDNNIDNVLQRASSECKTNNKMRPNDFVYSNIRLSISDCNHQPKQDHLSNIAMRLDQM